MNFKILSDSSKKIIYRSNTQSANTLLDKNILLDPLILPKIVKLKKYSSNDGTMSTMLFTIVDYNCLPDATCIPIIDPSDLVENTFLMPTNENGQHLQVRIVEAI